MDRNLDGIYVRANRGNGYEAVCLSDLTESQLQDWLDEHKANPNAIEWLKGAVVHLAVTLKQVGDMFDIVRSD